MPKILLLLVILYTFLQTVSATTQAQCALCYAAGSSKSNHLPKELKAKGEQENL